LSSSGACVFHFTLFNLQGARRSSAAGPLLYHISGPLSRTFFSPFSKAFRQFSTARLTRTFVFYYIPFALSRPFFKTLQIPLSSGSYSPASREALD
ncbi:hypothetical protein NE626_10215, partial [Intestinimonas massiliensis]|uniref:hypothetical protein n=1 Tax=Intestinimonas massiliensis (ex Afouda et al. 2020) TaxID=1673721 RepID=UPI00210A6FE7